MSLTSSDHYFACKKKAEDNNLGIVEEKSQSEIYSGYTKVEIHLPKQVAERLMKFDPTFVKLVW